VRHSPSTYERFGKRLRQPSYTDAPLDQVLPTRRDQHGCGRQCAGGGNQSRAAPERELSASYETLRKNTGGRLTITVALVRNMPNNSMQLTALRAAVDAERYAMAASTH